MTKVTPLSLNETGGQNRKRIHLREITGDVDTPLGTVGQDLRAARLRLGEDLATVSRALKIRRDHLESLEEERFAALPGRAYAVGFIRSYADYLGLDVAQYVERFKEEIAGLGEAPLPIVHDIIDERKLPHGWLVIAAVVAGLVIYGVYHLMTSGDSLANQPVAAVPQQLSPVAAKKPAPPFVRAAAVSAPAIKAPPPNVATAAQPSAAPAAIPVATTAKPPVAAAVAPAAALPAGQSYGLMNKTARVVLRVHAATTIEVKTADGKVYINRPLKPGDTYKVPLLSGITLTTSDGNAVELDLDGQSMGMASKNGVATALPLDPQAVADHVNKPG